ncbi:Dot/Icm T4SS effector CoxCC12 [Coxiella burnetii]|uniref:Dot/Icm T4SS effector CoxCC12 n=1 Tax=Coxiella burnetii TaxID=777 RepID=UPI0002D9AE0A|nr:Dot/Icm T4SS effector CoxCC12 [Coxiella burnetii]ATN86495.1 hypothetical protein AYO29_08760 [Coxiella burnetii str. Schperling]PHH56606.1 hypothetical protein CRH12_09905 [Coxiella burnetii]
MPITSLEFSRDRIMQFLEKLKFFETVICPISFFPELEASKRIRNKANLVLAIADSMEGTQKIKLEIWPFEEYAARDFTQKDRLWYHSLDGLAAVLKELKELNHSISLSIIFMGETHDINDLSDDLTMSQKSHPGQLLKLSTIRNKIRYFYDTNRESLRCFFKKVLTNCPNVTFQISNPPYLKKSIHDPKDLINKTAQDYGELMNLDIVDEIIQKLKENISAYLPNSSEKEHKVTQDEINALKQKLKIQLKLDEDLKIYDKVMERIKNATLNSGLAELKIAEFIEITPPSSSSDENIHYLMRKFRARGPFQKSKTKTSAESFNNEQIMKISFELQQQLYDSYIAVIHKPPFSFNQLTQRYNEIPQEFFPSSETSPPAEVKSNDQERSSKRIRRESDENDASTQCYRALLACTQGLKNAILSETTAEEKVATLKKLSELLKRTVSEEGVIEPEITQQSARNGKEEKEPTPLENKSSEQHLVYATQEQLHKLEERIEFLEALYERSDDDTEASSLSPSERNSPNSSSFFSTSRATDLEQKQKDTSPRNNN